MMSDNRFGNLFLLIPPIGFWYYWMTDKSQKQTELFVLAAALFFFTFFSHTLCYFFTRLSPFFLESFFELIFDLNTMFCCGLYTTACALEMFYPDRHWPKTLLDRLIRMKNRWIS